MTNFYCFAAAALPALLFTLLSEIFSALLHMAADAAAARGLLHISVGLLDALITALSLTAAGAAFLRKSSLRYFRRRSAGPSVEWFTAFCGSDRKIAGGITGSGRCNGSTCFCGGTYIRNGNAFYGRAYFPGADIFRPATEKLR